MSSIFATDAYSVLMSTELGPLGAWLEHERERAGWSLREFAERIGVEHSTLSRWISGERRPRAEMYPRIAEAVGLPVEVVMYEAGVIPRLPRPRSEYEHQRELQEVARQARAGIARLETVFTMPPEPAVRFYGSVPASAARWVEAKEGGAVRAVLVEWLGTRSPEEFFAVEASGECLASRKIHAGEYALFEHSRGQEPDQGQIVVVRLGNEVIMMVWQREGDWIELRDGDDNVVRRFSILEDFHVEGLYTGKHWAS